MGYLLGEDGGCGWHDLNFTTWTDAYMCFKNVIPPPLQHLQIVLIYAHDIARLAGGVNATSCPEFQKSLCLK